MAKEIKEKNNKEEEIIQKKANRDIFFDYLPYIIIILIVIIIRTYIATPIRVNGTSMEDTLYNGETMILNKLAIATSGVKRWDIVVIELEETHLIKRVIGLPGETIRYENDKLYINDQEVIDKYSRTRTEDFAEVKIGKDQYYVMGDNRSISQDSRMIGPVSKSEIKGKTNIILFPIDRFGFVEK